jgi:hypothetical protein
MPIEQGSLLYKNTVSLNDELSRHPKTPAFPAEAGRGNRQFRAAALDHILALEWQLQFFGVQREVEDPWIGGRAASLPLVDVDISLALVRVEINLAPFALRKFKADLSNLIAARASGFAPCHRSRTKIIKRLNAVWAVVKLLYIYPVIKGDPYETF